MQTVLRDTPAPPHKLRIVFGRPITGNHVDLAPAIDLFLHKIHMFQHTHIDGSHFSRVMTTQNMIHLIQRGEVIIAFVITILDLQPFVRVDVEEGKFAVREPASMCH
jgi:hypothetical protein